MNFVFDSVSIRDLVCSKNYSLALSDEGEVFSWGRGALGQLGSGSDQSRVYPEKIKFK
jgi:alpha-tubulin suppressor-like RCC1 family protein